ncbi:MAG TPA: UDP-N-acetylmuramate--L-alanine ligase [Cyclobacteriaceae bacterium]
MKLDKIHSVYFLGIGGIGMSALARWFAHAGKNVSGYDRTSTDLTTKLQYEGIPIHFSDDINCIDEQVLNNPGESLIIYTPAIPKDHKEFNYLKEKGFSIKKRAEVLGIISRAHFTIAVAGTHGKTTTSSMIAHILHHSEHGCSAFIGGIMTNYESNLIIGSVNDPVVVEADEFDRSFLHINPDIAIVTSLDPDHLDIYGDHTSMTETFSQFVGNTKKGGTLIINTQVNIQKPAINLISYSDGGKAFSGNIQIQDAAMMFDYYGPGHNIEAISLSLPGVHNINNAVAAITSALLLGVPPKKVKEALKRYKGVKRRFEYIIKSDGFIFIDDYAHHPKEIEALISSVKTMYPDKKITGIFQPHLYSRTRDFMKDFAESLEPLDEVILLDIYPAREEPLPGITSEVLLGMIKNPKKKRLKKDQLIKDLMNNELEVLLTIGAGDIDQLVRPIAQALNPGKS